jgi:predicted phosphodiesterase
MKILIVSDLHGEHPKGLVEQSLEQGIGCFAFLGDYDAPQIVDYLMNLGVPDKIVLIGNHDSCHNRGESLECRDFDSRAWERYQDARDFIERWSNIDNSTCFGLKTSRFADGIKIGFVHSSLQPKTKPLFGLNYLWGNLDTPLEKIENFRTMQSFTMNILFRGHEHSPYIIQINKDETLEGQGLELEGIAKRIEIKTPGFDNPLILESDKRHIISTPAFKWKKYAVFDTKTRELEFKTYS